MREVRLHFLAVRTTLCTGVSMPLSVMHLTLTASRNVLSFSTSNSRATLHASIPVTDLVFRATRRVNSPGPQPTSKTFLLRARLSISWSNSYSPSLPSRIILSRKRRSLTFHLVPVLRLLFLFHSSYPASSALPICLKKLPRRRNESQTAIRA